MHQIAKLTRPVIVVFTAAIALCATLLLFLNTVSAATLVVTSSNDDGPGSLRQVISDTLTLPGADQITFDPSLDGQTITLTSGQLVISAEVDIDASSLPNGVEISANDQSRVLFIQPGAIVTIDNITIRNGATSTGFGACDDLCGGGIFASPNSTVTIKNSQILDNFGNSAGGIINSGNMIISGTLVSRNRAAFDGGGIRNSAKMTIINSSILSNTNDSVVGGAGIYEEIGELFIENSTIAHNRAVGQGGGIHSFASRSLVIHQSTIAHNSATAEGGGVFIDSAEFITGTTTALTFINSTLSNNSANSGGGVYGSATLTTSLAVTLTHTTLSENSGGGVHVVSDTGGVATATIQSTIIANSIGNNCTGVSGDGFSLSDDDSCSGFTTGNPQLAGLADNGGTTQTHALLVNSAAFSLGDPSICQLHGVDQRGIERGATACDAGSVEFANSYLLFLPSIVR